MEEPKTIPGLLGDGFTGKEKVPAQVEVLDCKYGNVIGYRPRKEVRQLLLEDVRFVGNVSSEGVVQLIYSPRAAQAGMTILCETFDLYVKYIRAHLKTAVSCDDPLRKWLQVSFEHNRRYCVVALPLKKRIYDEMAKGGPVVQKALKHCTTGLISYLKKHPDRFVAEPAVRSPFKSKGRGGGAQGPAHDRLQESPKKGIGYGNGEPDRRELRGSDQGRRRPRGLLGHVVWSLSQAGRNSGGAGTGNVRQVQGRQGQRGGRAGAGEEVRGGEGTLGVHPQGRQDRGPVRRLARQEDYRRPRG